MNLQDLTHCLEEIGPLIHAEEVREYSTQQWAIAFENEFIVMVEADLDLGKLFFLSDLGKIEAPDPSSHYRWMLQLASVWHETGGTRVAINPQDEHVEFIYDTPLEGLTLEKLRIQLINFHEAALEVQTMIQSEFDVTSDSSPSEPTIHMLRV